MSTLSTIASDLESLAKAEWDKVTAEAKVIYQEVEPVVESSFAQLASQFGNLAVQTVINLMTEEFAALTGNAKLNLTATTIVDAAEKAGVTTLAEDVTALAKNAYTAAMGTAPAAA